MSYPIRPNPLGLSQTAIAKRLLVHGALTGAQFADITGWPSNRCGDVLSKLRKAGQVGISHSEGRRVYRLIGGAGALL